ncbi:hypothetical protein PspLS_01584 [Pyricularia sp. CBS 133598]|nr:hypothetical protein PspLS_01584 [Pyricularia sp. CBS 133598]
MAYDASGEYVLLPISPVAIMMNDWKESYVPDLTSILLAETPDTPIILGPAGQQASYYIPESPLVSEGWIPYTRGFGDKKPILNANPACGNGPLSYAVINNDQSAIANILAKD